MEEQIQEQEPEFRSVVILDKKNMVVGIMPWPLDQPKQQLLDEYYSDLYYVLDYEKLETKTDAAPGCFWDAELNGFVERRPLNEPTYVFNKNTLRWEPDPNLEYDIDGDGTLDKWDPETATFYSVYTPPELDTSEE